MEGHDFTGRGEELLERHFRHVEPVVSIYQPGTWAGVGQAGEAGRGPVTGPQCTIGGRPSAVPAAARVGGTAVRGPRWHLEAGGRALWGSTSLGLGLVAPVSVSFGLCSVLQTFQQFQHGNFT